MPHVVANGISHKQYLLSFVSFQKLPTIKPVSKKKKFSFLLHSDLLRSEYWIPIWKKNKSWVKKWEPWKIIRRGFPSIVEVILVSSTIFEAIKSLTNERTIFRRIIESRMINDPVSLRVITWLLLLLLLNGKRWHRP